MNANQPVDLSRETIRSHLLIMNIAEPDRNVTTIQNKVISATTGLQPSRWGTFVGGDVKYGWFQSFKHPTYENILDSYTQLLAFRNVPLQERIGEVSTSEETQGAISVAKTSVSKGTFAETLQMTFARKNAQIAAKEFAIDLTNRQLVNGNLTAAEANTYENKSQLVAGLIGLATAATIVGLGLLFLNSVTSRSHNIYFR